MLKAVIDTNVLLVANQQHGDMSLECVVACIEHLQSIQNTGVVVLDDNFFILNEYQNKTRLNPPKGVGDVFLKGLLRNLGNPARVEMVSITATDNQSFAEFPDPQLQIEFDSADRVFPAVANAHQDKPPIWQAADCKWLLWWPALQKKGIQVHFLCPQDTQRFYVNKFPEQPKPPLPESR